MGLTTCRKLGICYLPCAAEYLASAVNAGIPSLRGLVDKVICARNSSYLGWAVLMGGAIGLAKNGHPGFIGMTVFGGVFALAMAKKAHSNTQEALSAIENHKRQSEASSKALESHFLFVCSDRQENLRNEQTSLEAVSINISREDPRETG